MVECLATNQEAAGSSPVGRNFFLLFYFFWLFGKKLLVIQTNFSMDNIHSSVSQIVIIHIIYASLYYYQTHLSMSFGGNLLYKGIYIIYIFFFLSRFNRNFLGRSCNFQTLCSTKLLAGHYILP